MNDRQIIDLLWQRSETALEALAFRFGRRLQSMAMNILDDLRDVQECVNDTYLALWNAIPPKRPDPLEGFVLRTGKNIALNRLRSNTAQKRSGNYDLSLQELETCIPGICLEETVHARELGRSIDAFLDTLDAKSRVIFLRRHWFGDGVTEIAAALGMSPGAVSVRLNRVRSKLQVYLSRNFS